MNAKELLTSCTGGRLKEVFLRCREVRLEGVFEIRVRADKPLILRKPQTEMFVDVHGCVVSGAEQAYKPSLKDVADCVEVMSNYSLYAFQEEIRNGFITLRGGHRVGVSGRAVYENGGVKVFKGINGLNIRVAREIKGCAVPVITYVDRPLHSTMIISPPGRGKTTLLRDLTRLLSDRGYNVGVVDERSEIAGMYMGVAQNDVGVRTDVLDGCPKEAGMFTLLRSMSPDIIVVDEIGGSGETAAVEQITASGVKLICTAHGGGVEDIGKNSILRELMQNKVFGRYIVLAADGSMGQITI